MDVPENWMLKSGESFRTLIAWKLHPQKETSTVNLACSGQKKKKKRNQYAQKKEPDNKTASRSSARKIYKHYQSPAFSESRGRSDLKQEKKEIKDF